MARVIQVVVLLGVSALGGWTAFKGVQVGIKIHRIRGWPSVQGTVVEHTPSRIAYTYHVAGKQHSQQRAGEFESHEHPLGAALTVYYNPANPAEAFMQPGDYASAAIIVGFGAGLILVCAPFVVMHGAMLYCHLMLAKMRYHLRKAAEAMEEGDAIVRETEQHGPVPGDLAAARQAAIERAASVGVELRELERRVSGRRDEE